MGLRSLKCFIECSLHNRPLLFKQQGPTALAVGAGGGCLDIFTLIYPFSFLSPSLWETTRYRLKYCLKGSGVVGWCDGAGSTSSAGASYNLDTVGQGPTALAVGAGGGCLDIFTLIYPFSPLSPSLWETARYRLKYCLKGPLNPKQPTNQLFKQPLTRLSS